MRIILTERRLCPSPWLEDEVYLLVPGLWLPQMVLKGSLSSSMATTWLNGKDLEVRWLSDDLNDLLHSLPLEFFEFNKFCVR